MRKFLMSLIVCGLMLACGPAAHSETGRTELVWYGHAAFKLTTPKGHVLFIDPWIVNPVNPDGKADLANIKKADLVLVTHGHFDHVGNAADIARQTGARLVSTFDLGNALVTYGGYPADQMGYDSQGNFGGTLSFFDNEVRVAFIPAVHSSAVDPKSMGVSEARDKHDAGNPGGFLIMIENGPTIYHTGDTDYFSDMALVPQFKPVDVMLVCMGDHFTMGPDRAAMAVAAVKPRAVIPMHYGTFPILTGTVEQFDKALKAKRLPVKLQPLKLEEAATLDAAGR